MFWRKSLSHSQEPITVRLNVEMLHDRLSPSDVLGAYENSSTVSYGQATDGYQRTQNTITITSFTVVALANGYYHISGHVSADDLTGMTVVLGGGPHVSGVIVTVDADGNFSAVIQLTSADSGEITATAVDVNGELSNVAVDDLIIN
jgi:hypothetical protein